MSNLLERLRAVQADDAQPDAMCELAQDAADEIELLRRAVAARDHVPGDPAQAPYVVQRLRACADDPMWADHAEVSKKLLHEAANQILGMFALLQNRGAQ